MDKLTDKLLQQYADGELSPSKAERVERLLEQQSDSQDYLREISKVGDFVRLMNEEKLTEVDFEGFSDQVARKIRQSERQGTTWERITVAVSEFMEHRRVVWVPSVAVAAGALLIAFVLSPLSPFSYTGRSPGPAPGEGIQLLSAAPKDTATEQSSKIESVDFGDSKGASYAINDEQGGTVGVVWIVEAP